MLKAPLPGQTEFPACREWSPASSGCNCNSGPPGVNCGRGLIEAECSMSDNKVTYKKADSATVGSSGRGQLRAR